jgi:KaiC/GvpD/RAD55 family RecA-like ATPase
MNERTVIAALIQSREAYDSITPYHEEEDFSDMGALVFKEVDKYYCRDDTATSMDKEILLTRLIRAYPKASDKFTAFVESLTTVSVANILDDYRSMKSDSLGELVGGYLMAGEHGKAAELLDKYNLLQAEGLQREGGDSPVVYSDADVAEFGESVSKANRIPIAPKELNRLLGGGLIPGSHTLVYAPPEVGKTAFAINTAYSIACNKKSREGDRCLYIGNEESADMYLNRLLCRFTQWDIDTVLADKPAAMALARKRGWKNLIFVHLSPGSIQQVQKLVLEHKPKVVIIDQIHNLILGKGKEPEKTQLLERLAYTMRMFYSRHKIAGISFSQADEKAIGKLYLTIKDVYYSNIGVQGQTDAMIGIGMNDNFKAMNRRCLCITKNKLGGEHGNVIVQLYNKISAYKSLGE